MRTRSPVHLGFRAEMIIELVLKLGGFKKWRKGSSSPFGGQRKKFEPKQMNKTPHIES